MKLNLEKFTIFQGLTPEERIRISSSLQSRSFRKGQFIIAKEDEGSSMMFILKGEVEVGITSGEGREVILSKLCEGDFFGELALLTGKARSANVIAVSACEVAVLSESDLKKSLKDVPNFAYAFLQELAQRVLISSSKIEDLALYDVYNRLKRTLHRMAKEVHLNGQKVLEISERPTHQNLAAVVGTSREMVTRALKTLEDEGVIEVLGKKIIITQERR